MLQLNGTWVYQSFRPFTGPPSPLVPWSPPGELSVSTDATGKVDGRLVIQLGTHELHFHITGSITPGANTGPVPVPEGVQLTGTAMVRAGESVNELRGYSVPGGASPVIVGTIWAVKNDPAGEPDGTSGPFVLFPANSTR